MGDMPWKMISLMDERSRFIKMVQQKKHSFADLCREFGISRKTGYKWWRRFSEEGQKAFSLRSSRPNRSPKCTEQWLCRLLVKLRMEHPTWGPKKIQVLARERCKVRAVPAVSTIGTIFKRMGLVRLRKRRKPWVRYWPGGLTVPKRCNEVWTVDFKGYKRARDGQRCEPLTIRDEYSRFILAIRILENQTLEQTRWVFEQVFREYGLPEIIRCDNGTPFGSTGTRGLSKLAVWWISLGIRVEYGRPGRPCDNGGHERMHRDLEGNMEDPAANLRAEQRRADNFRWQFDYDRPHEALGMKRPGEVYEKSNRSYEEQLARKLSYPAYYEVRQGRTSGEIKWQGKLYFIGEAFTGVSVGLRQMPGGKVEVYLRDMQLGVIDGKKRIFRPIIRSRRRKIAKDAAAGGAPSAAQPPFPGEDDPCGLACLRSRIPIERAVYKKRKKELKSVT